MVMKYDIAQALYPKADDHNASLQVASSGATMSSGTTQRYATVEAKNEDGTYEVTLHGTGTKITVRSDGVYNPGDVVCISKDGTTYAIVGFAGLKTYIDQTATGIEMGVSGIKADVDGALTEMSTKYDQRLDSFNFTITQTKNAADSAVAKAEQLEKYVWFDENGVNVGEKGSTYISNVDNDGFHIYSKGNPQYLIDDGNPLNITVSNGSACISTGSDGTIAMTTYPLEINAGRSPKLKFFDDGVTLDRYDLLDVCYEALYGSKGATWTPIKSSGTTGTIRLTQSKNNFDLICVCYYNEKGGHESTIMPATGSYMSLSSSYIDANGAKFEGKHITWSSTTGTVSDGGRGYIALGGGTVNAAQKTTFITVSQVYGIKF